MLLPAQDSISIDHQFTVQDRPSAGWAPSVLLLPQLRTISVATKVCDHFKLWIYLPDCGRGWQGG